MIRVRIYWRRPDRGGRQAPPSGSTYAATLKFWPRASYETPSPIDPELQHSFVVADRRFVHTMLEYASLSFLDETLEAESNQRMFTVFEGPNEVADACFLGCKGHPSLSSEPDPSIYVAKVPAVWKDLLALTEDEIKAREVRRERLKVPIGAGQFYYPFPKVAIDDPRPHNNDERVVYGQEIGKPRHLGCVVVLARDSRERGYAINLCLQETHHGEITRKIPFEYFGTDDFGQPCFVRVEVEA